MAAMRRQAALCADLLRPALNRRSHVPGLGQHGRIVRPEQLADQALALIAAIAEYRLHGDILIHHHHASGFGNYAFAGIKLDPNLNETAKGEARISAKDSRVEIWILPTNEEIVVARQTVEGLGSRV